VASSSDTTSAQLECQHASSQDFLNYPNSKERMADTRPSSLSTLISQPDFVRQETAKVVIGGITSGKAAPNFLVDPYPYIQPILIVSFSSS
jgi:hypothetical protein